MMSCIALTHSDLSTLASVVAQMLALYLVGGAVVGWALVRIIRKRKGQAHGTF
jgi:hypothetical protein